MMIKRTVTIVVSRERLVMKKKRDGRSMYEPAAKRTLIEACLQPGVSIGVHLFLLPNPQRWKRALARGELSKPLNDKDFLPRFLR
jgi:hypothetical protein